MRRWPRPAASSALLIWNSFCPAWRSLPTVRCGPGSARRAGGRSCRSYSAFSCVERTCSSKSMIRFLARCSLLAASPTAFSSLAAVQTRGPALPAGWPGARRRWRCARSLRLVGWRARATCSCSREIRRSAWAFVFPQRLRGALAAPERNLRPGEPDRAAAAALPDL